MWLARTNSWGGKYDAVNNVKHRRNRWNQKNNLGFVVGAEVAVVSAIGGNVIVNIKDSRVAINEDMAKRIMV